MVFASIVEYALQIVNFCFIYSFNKKYKIICGIEDRVRLFNYFFLMLISLLPGTINKQIYCLVQWHLEFYLLPPSHNRNRGNIFCVFCSFLCSIDKNGTWFFTILTIFSFFDFLDEHIKKSDCLWMAYYLTILHLKTNNKTFFKKFYDTKSTKWTEMVKERRMNWLWCRMSRLAHTQCYTHHNILIFTLKLDFHGFFLFSFSSCSI